MPEHDSCSTSHNPHHEEHALSPSYVNPEAVIPESSFQDKALMLVAVLSLIAVLYFGVMWALGTADSPPTGSDAGVP